MGSALNVFGLTGNTGTGKSTVADALRLRGIPVVDADRIARDIVEPGQPALEEIIATFGSEFLDDDGRLRRRELGRLVFGDPSARAKLEAITHPRIARHARQQLADLEADGVSTTVYDSAILVETGLAKAFEALIVVYAEPRQQLERIIGRDGLSEEDAQQRIDAQMPLAQKVELADYVVMNTGTLADLDVEIAKLVDWIRRRAEVASGNGRR